MSLFESQTQILDIHIIQLSLIESAVLVRRCLASKASEVF